MTLEKLLKPFPWSQYSKKLAQKIEKPRNVGIFLKEDAEERGVRLVTAEAGKKELGNRIRFYWLVDKEDGKLIDVRFQAYGQSALIGAAEVTAELLIGKNYDQAKRISTDLIDLGARDKDSIPAFPKEAYPILNLVLEAVENGSEQCTDLPLPDTYFAPPTSASGPGEKEQVEGWYELPLKKKLAIIESVLDREIRPYIALDAGGVEVINLLNDREVVITYQGSCTSCYSSVGSTLAYIQQMLKNKVHPDITVVPDVDPSQFH